MNNVTNILKRTPPDSGPAQALEAARRRVKALLVDPESITSAQAKVILSRYTAGVGDNFIKWLGAALVSARSLEARFAASENLMVEVRDNHPKMLRDFAKGSGALPGREDYAHAAVCLDEIHLHVRHMSGIYLISLIQLLETVSADYIPWLAAISKKLGNTNFNYCDIHGEADAHHAEQFRKAVVAESQFYKSPLPEIEEGYGSGVYFLEHLLSHSSAPAN